MPPKYDVGATPQAFVPCVALAELPPGSQRSVVCGVLRVLVCHTGEGVFAVRDLCPHALQPLAGGEIVGGLIRCPKHGALFALATGEPENSVTNERLTTFRIRLRHGQIEIATEAGP